jgi:hypothetical protein
MKRWSATNKSLNNIPLDIRAEMALKEAVADAIAKHKKLGYPISIWRNGKVVSIPAHEIVIPSQDTRSTDANKYHLLTPAKNESIQTSTKESQVKEKVRTYRKTREKKK